MDIPSWCRVGAKVVCVKTWHREAGYADEVGPVAGEVYTIREVGCLHPDYPGIEHVRLVEIANKVRRYIGDIEPWEPCFYLHRFRPLVTLEDDLKAHFVQYLNTPAPVTTNEREQA